MKFFLSLSLSQILSKVDLLSLLKSNKTTDEEDVSSTTESLDESSSLTRHQPVNETISSTTESILTDEKSSGDNENYIDYDNEDSCLPTHSMTSSSTSDTEIDGVEFVKSSADPVIEKSVISVESVEDYSNGGGVVVRSTSSQGEREREKLGIIYLLHCRLESHYRKMV